LFLLLQAATFAQQAPTTADQVISSYMEAIGAERFSFVSTFVEIGDFDGNVTSLNLGYLSPGQYRDKTRGTFEIYFKSPNLRFSSRLSETNQLVELDGCDGKVAWYIDSAGRRTEFKPKPGSEYGCDEGFKPPLSRLRDRTSRMRLVKKNPVEGRAAWEVKVDVPKSSVSETYYFDAETFLLLRFETRGISTTYSDYRDAGGIKFPFKTVLESERSKFVTTVRELKINAPIDDARFAEPQVKNGRLVQAPVSPADKGTSAVSSVVPSTIPPPPSASTRAEIADVSTPASPATPNPASVVETNFPNFTSCTIAELQMIIPELKGLKPPADQARLSLLLDKVGAKTVEIARNTPNLISRETVTESPQGPSETRAYDYLILARIEGKEVGLDEFRVDLRSGEKFQTDEVMKDESSARAVLERASHGLAASKSGRPPASQGFATAWVHFYPLNRARATFRYLGEQKMDGHRTLVLAFAQRPAAVVSPAMFRYQGKTVPMFLQGVAWVDPSDFRILRLRTDLLAPLPEASLDRMTADVQFGLTRIETVPSPLSLPREVTVTSLVGGAPMREIHRYSEYRLFRAKSRIVLTP